MLDILNILAPILLIVALGAVLRWRFHTDLATLSKLNIHVLVPAFIFDKVSHSKLLWGEMGGIVFVTALNVMLLGAVVLLVGRAAGAARKPLAAAALGVMFYNSGNYGLPLAELAFGGRGGAAQAFVLMTMNVLTFTVGLSIAAGASGRGILRGLLDLLKMPILPALAGGVLAKMWLDSDGANQIPRGLDKTIGYLSDGLVPVALLTLGTQLAIRPRWPRWRPVSLVLVLRLLYAPAQMAVILWGLSLVFGWLGRPGWMSGLDLWPWPAVLLVLTAAVPTAINTLLLTLEMGGDAELAADSVFWTTIGSCLTIPLWIWAARAVLH